MTLAAAHRTSTIAMATFLAACLFGFAVLIATADRPALSGATMDKIRDGQEHITIRSSSHSRGERAANAIHQRGYRLLQAETSEWSGTTTLYFQRRPPAQPQEAQP